MSRASFGETETGAYDPEEYASIYDYRLSDMSGLEYAGSRIPKQNVLG
jgi:hypothetical protein